MRELRIAPSGLPCNFRYVRSKDLKPGSKYRLARDRDRIVRYLETPPEVRSHARVRVEFVNGILAGRITDIPTRRILEPLVPDPPRAPKAAPKPITIHSDRTPVVGDEVIWKATGEIVWRVESIHGASATLTGELLSRPRRETAKLQDLEVRPDVIHPTQTSTLTSTESPPTVMTPTVKSIAPIKPQRQLDEVMDSIMFDQRALRAYQKRFERSAKTSEIEGKLRAEIRGRGYLEFEEIPEREWSRIRVERRFDIVLARKPSPDDPLWIDRLAFPRSHRPRTSRKRRP